MANVVSVHNASGVVHSGAGMVYGIVITASAGNPQVTLSNGVAPGGTKNFDAYGSTGNPLVIFFSDQFALRYSTGIYITIGAANCMVTLWTRQL